MREKFEYILHFPIIATLIIALNLTIGKWSFIEILKWFDIGLSDFLITIAAYAMGPFFVAIYLIGSIIKILIGI